MTRRHPLSFKEMIKKGHAQRLGLEYTPPGAIKRGPHLGKKSSSTSTGKKEKEAVHKKGIKQTK